MQQVWGTSLRKVELGARQPAPAPPLVQPLPGPESPTPRRRRTIVCTNLKIEGEVWGLEQARLKMKDALRGDKADLRCSKRPGIQLTADYALDVCLSSWCRNCPFQTPS